MHQSIQKISDRFVGAVKPEKPFYTLKDLIKVGYPPFIVELIRLWLNRKIEEGIVFPQTDWADLNEELVAESWQDFKETVYSNSRIPKNKLSKLTGEIVEEIVKVYLEPRQHMAEYIYKGEDELSFEELRLRTDQLTIYKHFGRAIPLYMQKRKLNTLEKKRCKLLIHKLDANLVASYTAEDWAKVLGLLFALFDGKIDSKLLQYFFEDKELFLTAKTFNKLDKEVTKAQFIEILSKPDLLNVELQEKVKEELREELVNQKNRFDDPDEEEIVEIDEKEQKLLDSFLVKYEDEAGDPHEESLNALFKAGDSERTIHDERSKGGETQRFRDNLTSVLDMAASSFNNLSQEDEPEQPEEEEKPKKSKREEAEKKETVEPEKKPVPKKKKAEPEKNKDEEKEKPIWQQYINQEQMDIVMGKKTDKAEDEETVIFVEEDDFIDESVVDIVPEDESAAPDLRVYLLGQEVFYIEELFNGSEERYVHALERIAVHDEWKEAGKYLQREVFSSGKIDMFSDAAVDFTDMLQAYFKEFKN
ncbi:MAG: hypothetical protein WD016_06620 [Balneolaceae bacterium]